MENTLPGPFEPMPAITAIRAEAAPAHEQRLPIVFTASGSEYFRIWILNLLLTVVTLGLYLPWAKVRRLRYFYGNTSLDGHAFDFHGNPRRMLRGLLLVGALVLLYSFAGQVSPVAGLVAFAIVATVWPALFRASQQFRMANTSWRGLRFRFNGSLAGAYAAMLPLFVPGAALAVVAAVAGHRLEDVATAELDRTMKVVVPLMVLLPVLLAPLLLWMLKKYQHDHYALGHLQTTLRSGVGSFYLLFLKALGVTLLAGLVLGIVAGLVSVLGSAATVLALFAGAGGAPSRGSITTMIALVVVFSLLLYVVSLSVVAPYVTSRLQNLVWGRTEAPSLRFVSAVPFWSIFGLTLKNWLLILLTLGLYAPFAKVAMARLRLQSVSVLTTLSPDALRAAFDAPANDASGDAAGDLFGIDIGL